MRGSSSTASISTASRPATIPAHKHARPEESVEKLQDFWKAIYAQALAINPDAVIEICPCGTVLAFHNMPYMNQPVASDPDSSWQVRHKGKTIKALMGPSAAYAGDHVELSDHGNDFASTIGIGAIVSTKFTWPRDANAKSKTLAHAAQGGAVAQVDRALQREEIARGELSRRALRHRLRQA